MIKILHSGDWHLDSPLQGKTAALRAELQKIPGKLAALCRSQQCDLVLLSGDLFDGAYSQETYRLVYDALEQMEVPVLIAPGNHDYLCPQSPYEREIWPENVHIFHKQQIQWVDLPELDLRVYGAGYESMDCPPLLEGFRAEVNGIGLFHADPTQANSPYNPVTKAQVAQCNLKYLALGHVHKGGAFREGNTLCAWPGCPMGRGWDEQGEKGALIVTLDTEAQLRFVPLGAPQFHDLTADAADGIGSVLPAVAGGDFYRVTLTGESEPVDLESLQRQFAAFPNLVLRDATVLPVDIWRSAGEDSFEGVYFDILKNMLENAPEEEKETILLAAKLSRQLLEGREVALP